MSVEPREVLIITLDGRMPSDDRGQADLQAAASALLAHGGEREKRGTFFVIVREEFDAAVAAGSASAKDFYATCTERFGPNCHVSGAITERACCLVVVRSRREDDHSAPQLEALRKAASQLSGTRPGFIAMQYDDITTQDFLLPHVRRRAALLCYYLYLKTRAAHVLTTSFSPYGGIAVSGQGAGSPAFAVPNPEPAFSVRAADYGPFLEHVPDEEFARIVGGSLPTESISYIPIDPDPGRERAP